jgi:serine/threonine-protein kinase
LLLLGALAITFVGSAMLTIYLLFQAGEVRVPNIVGMSQEDAQKAIVKAGLTFRLRRQHFDGTVPVGAVTDQDPQAGFPVKVGFDVKVDVSKGPDPTGGDVIPEPIGPTNPVDGPKDEKKKDDKKKDENKNSNTAKPEDGKTGKEDQNENVKPKPKPGDEIKSDESAPKPPKPKPADVKTDEPPKPKPKPKPAQVPPHD